MSVSIRSLGWLGRAPRVPFVSDVLGRAYRQYFIKKRGHVRLFHGLYPNFEAALADVPDGTLSDCDNEASAERLLDEWLTICPSDYPIMFWLAKLLPKARFVFDWGGNVGLKYFAFRRHLEFGDEHRWLVSDVPAVVELGRRIARRESPNAIQFTSGMDELAQADILLASGVLQFVGDPLSALRSAARLPRHLLINKLPVYELPSAVTLQNMGSAVCPYHLFNRTQLVTDLEKLGYRLIDEWKSPEVSCRIPFHRGHSVDAYSGFYFEKET